MRWEKPWVAAPANIVKILRFQYPPLRGVPNNLQLWGFRRVSAPCNTRTVAARRRLTRSDSAFVRYF